MQFFGKSELSPNTIVNMHSLVDESSAKSGEMVSVPRR